MNICMAGIDFETANIDTRQNFSFTADAQKTIYSRAKNVDGVLGVALLVTCNRTEIYLSCREGAKIDAFAVLCRASGADALYEPCRPLVRSRSGNEVFTYLCRLGCGALSQIWGEDQIITQVKTAIATARENNAADSNLEVLFRYAVTAAKKIKTDIKFTRNQPSVAAQVLNVLQSANLSSRRVLVIGNGEIGRMVTGLLVENGFEVTMTRRSYKHAGVQIPCGASSIEYSERYEHMHEFAAVVSATSSPHLTVEFGAFSQLSPMPRVLLDLAVPRDIDEKIGTLAGIEIYDVDTLCRDEIRENHDELMAQADVIIEKYRADLEKWENYKNAAQSNVRQSASGAI